MFTNKIENFKMNFGGYIKQIYYVHITLLQHYQEISKNQTLYKEILWWWWKIWNELLVAEKALRVFNH